MKINPAFSLILVAAAAANAPAYGGVDLNINLGTPAVVQAVPAAPPVIAVDEAPQLIYTPSLGLYVAVGIPYDLVYTGTDYLCYYGGRWYRGPNYYGPWVIAAGRNLPPVLLKYRIDRIRGFRDAEYRIYRRDPGHYAGRFHHPEFHRAKGHEERREVGREEHREERHDEHREGFHERR